ncbi:ABC transporter permease [Leeuwenhoekiella marinoflava]|uniref:Lipoprotein-releasing system permease protein n=2 Tax=Leeuwenhoekiella marinoflava TaxID=988 RepID=A0A4Q0PQT4_9FLAO|nr:FtsX-like permease family protein [Leeuwenhoekiella marinoflava]RXG33000.1 lipoprotein-releasing system permease protein [Leeuwenhoekiella marinoflava]SHE35013.1 lipoprotein-releasing system permease protein [Leeuwenhoekiella marinoflava DSM 3653]
MKFSVFIAKRYLFTKSSNNAINIITLISAISIIAGSAALFIVLSGFSGLKDFSLSFSSVFDPDLKIIPASGKTISFSEKQREDLKDIEGVADYTQIIEERAFLEFRGKNHIAYIKGVDENYMRVNNIDSTLLYGNWITPEEPVAAIGFGISRILSLGVNNYTDLLRVMVPKPGTGQFTDPSQAFNTSQLVVSDIFQVNEEIDQKYIFTNLEYVRQLLRYDDTTLSALELKIKPNADPLVVKDSVQRLFGDQVEVKTRFQLNDKLYKMLNAENLAVYLIFTLVLIIALFNLVGSIIMIIIDKKANIKTLHSLGASLKEIKKIYFLQGAMMTVFGGLIGIFLGALIVGAQLQFQLKMITPTLPYPMEFTLVNFLAVFFTISILGILASYLASSTIRPKLLED